MTVVVAFNDQKFATWPRAVAAATTWLGIGLDDGFRPLAVWTNAHDQLVAGVQFPPAAANSRRWSVLSGRPGDKTWKLTNATWPAVFQSLVADEPRPGVGPAAAAAALRTGADTLTSRARVAIFEHNGVPRIVAAMVDQQALHLFDPHSGIHRFDRTGQGVDQPVGAFTRLMTTAYGDPVAGFEVHTSVVPVLDLYFAWFGGPRLTDKAGQPFPAASRPDLKGPAQLAAAPAATWANTPVRRLRFVCQRSQVNTFRQAFANLLGPAAHRVEVLAVEDHLPNPPTVLAAPDFSDLPGTVAYMMTSCLADPTDFRALTNAKNLWSLYVLYRYGGYHLDTGVILRPGMPLNLDRPTGFATMWVDVRRADGSVAPAAYNHVKGRVGPGPDPTCATLAADSDHLLMKLWTEYEGLKKVTMEPPREYQLVDVGIMRSPRWAPGLERALCLYLDAWFRIHPREAQIRNSVLRLTLDASELEPMDRWEVRKRQRIEATYRAAIVMAAATGLTHSRTGGRGCGYAPPTLGRDIFLDADLGLQKTGEQRHRTT